MAIVITGTQRSGTTALRTVLVRNGALDADEILHGSLNHEHRFFSFLAHKISVDPACASTIHLMPIFVEYMEKLHELANGRPVAMDVKYEHYNMIAARYSLFEPPIPYIIQYFADTKTPIIHMMRKNKLRMVVSRLIAEKTNVWGVPTGTSDATDKMIAPSPTEIVSSIADLVRAEEKAVEILKVCDVSDLYYEDTYLANGTLSPKAAAAVARCMGRDLQSSVPDMLKQNSEPLEALLANFTDIKVEIERDGRFTWMLDEHHNGDGHSSVSVVEELPKHPEVDKGMSMYKAARQLCGLSEVEASNLHKVSTDTIEQWDSGAQTAPMAAWMNLSLTFRQMETRGTSDDPTLLDDKYADRALATLIRFGAEDDA